MDDIIIGIDLGTTNSEVAIYENGQIKVIEVDGSRKLPSVVSIGDDGALLIGQTAKNQYHLYPERTVRSIKRRMGEDIKIPLGHESFSPQEISAIILKKLKQAAENYLNITVEKAVITVPAYFSDAQRQATREAGELAGLQVVKMINEPTAAALSYEGQHHASKKILVYDLGGGTFDVSVVQIENGVIEVIASHGNNHLGGDDFDQAVCQHIYRHLNLNPDAPGIPAEAQARIDRAAEQARCVLSDHPYAEIKEEYLFEKEGVPIHLSMELSRIQYEELIAHFIEETLEAVHIALDGADLRATDIGAILLVGGTTRTPFVKKRLEDEFGIEPRSEIDPDLGVAMGAAAQAAIIAGTQASTVLVDVTPYTFGTSAFHELDGMPYPYYFVPIIKKNTTIPVTRSEVFYTMTDGQREVMIEIYQGEDPDAQKNIKIGEFLIKGLSDARAGNEIITELNLDNDGILTVTSIEKKTGLKKGITIKNAMTRFEEEDFDKAKLKIARIFDDSQDSENADGTLLPRSEQVQAKALIEKAERLLDSANDDDREEMVDLIETVSDALSLGDCDKLREATEALSEIIFFLES